MVYNTKYLILGAGCSGLAFANYLNSSEYLIMEREKEAGGYCRTIRKDGYIWDYAGHFFHFATPYWKSFFEERIDKSEIISVKKNTKIYYKDSLIDYPFQKNIHQLPKDEFIDCLYDLFNRNENINGSTFEEMLYSKFGKSISDKFLIPYNEKLYACNLNSLDSDAMGRFFPYADIKDIINNMKRENNSSYNDYFLYPKNGAEVFIKALLRDIPNDNLLLGQECQNIDLKKQIVYSDKMEIHYEKLISTVPLNHFIKMFKNDFKKENLSCNKVLVFNLGFDKKSRYDKVHWMYVPDRDYNFYRIGFYDNILKQSKLSMYIEIGYRENEEIDVDEQLKLTLKNLRKMHVIENDFHLQSYSVCTMEPAYVHMSESSRKLTKEIRAFLDVQNVYTIGRYGSWKYCSIEDCLVEAEELFNKICRK